MNKIIIAVAALVLATNSGAFASGRMDPACKKGIYRDLLRKGYTVIYMNLLRWQDGFCDGETCNPDVLELYAEAVSSGKTINLIIEAFGPIRGDASCRVGTIKVVR